MSGVVVVGTWPFSSEPVSVVGNKLIEKKCSCVEALRQGINGDIHIYINGSFSEIGPFSDKQ